MNAQGTLSTVGVAYSYYKLTTNGHIIMISPEKKAVFAIILSIDYVIRLLCLPAVIV